MFRRRRKSRELITFRELVDAVCEDFEPTYPYLWLDEAVGLDDREETVSAKTENVVENVEQLSYDYVSFDYGFLPRTHAHFPDETLISAIREEVDELAVVVTSAEPAEQALVVRLYALLDFADRINSGGTVLALLESAPVRREPESEGPGFSSSGDPDRSDTVDTALETTGAAGARDSEGSPDTRASAIGSPDDDTGRDDGASRHSGPTADHSRPDGLHVEHGPAPHRPLSWDHIVFGIGLGWTLAWSVLTAATFVIAIRAAAEGQEGMPEVFAFLGVMGLFILIGLAIVVLWYRSRLRR